MTSPGEPNGERDVTPPTPGPSRRGLLTGALGGALGLAAGIGGTLAVGSGTPSTAPVPTAGTDPSGIGRPVAASGRYQAGIHTPATPQKFGRLIILDTTAAPTAAVRWLALLGERILELAGSTGAAGSEAAALLPDGAGDLTITVGLGPRIIASIGSGLPGGEPLPSFVGDEAIDDLAIGGDVLLAAYSNDPTVLGAVLTELTTLVPGATSRWEQLVFRGTGEGMKARNPLGFFDGVVVPRGDDELRDNVWITDGPLAGGTICVIRRLVLDTTGFRSLAVGDREAVFGRRMSDGAPLSGGKPDEQVDLQAKTPEGDFLVPASAHSRAAHPSFTGSSLMLRRSYSFENDRPGATSESGLTFISFQRDLRTFTATQHRLDEVDALMKFTRPTASATFLILPGFSSTKPLGAELA